MSMVTPQDIVRSFCRIMYRRHVTDLGFERPETLDEMRELVTQSGASVFFCADAPTDFAGVQIGSTVYVNASSFIPEWRKIRICAHEWCHWLRRADANDEPLSLHLYPSDTHVSSDLEEIIAREFELMFDIRFDP